MKFQFNDGGRQAAGYKGHTGDCVCRAIVIATVKPYQDVYDMLAIGNKTQRQTNRMLKTGKGKKTASNGIYVKRKWFKDYMHSLGFTWTPTMLVGKGCKVHLRSEELQLVGITLALLME